MALKVSCIDWNTHKMFDKEFKSVYEMKKFMNKCKYSKKISVVGFETNTQSEYEYIAY